MKLFILPKDFYSRRHVIKEIHPKANCNTFLVECGRHVSVVSVTKVTEITQGVGGFGRQRDRKLGERENNVTLCIY